MSQVWKDLCTAISATVEIRTELRRIANTGYKGQPVWITTVCVNGYTGDRNCRDCNYTEIAAKQWHKITESRLKLFNLLQQYDGVQETLVHVYDKQSAIANYITPKL